MLLTTVLQLGFVISFFYICGALQTTNPVIEIPLGKLQGTVLKTVNGNDFYAFRGIPYAKPPIKELRFKPPEPIARWNGIHDATEDGHSCIQVDMLRQNLLTGDEDCLYLNVYSAHLEPTVSKPVMVFIHGGGFMSGTGRSDVYGPERLLDKDIVLVTINYRISVLGFLSTGDSVVPGNNGLRDQVQALKWVRDNVAAFGGDPQRVTIFGESAGSASVTFHLLSPLSKGLFHAAIAQSGSANCPWGTLPRNDAISNTKSLAQRLNCPTDTSAAMVQCLRRRAALDLIVKNEKNADHSPLNFLPVVEERLGDEVFLTEHPQRLLENKQIDKVPVMIGINRDEGFMLLQFFSIAKGGVEHFRAEDLANAANTFPLANHNSNQNVYQRWIDKISQMDPENHLQRIDTISKIIGDVIMINNIDKTISSFAASGIPTYVYKLTYKGQNSATKMFLTNENDSVYVDKLKVVTHADELLYLFKTPFGTEQELDENDTKMADILLTLWTNFATNRVPSLDRNGPAFQWAPVEPGQPQYLDLNLEPKTETGILSYDPELMRPNDLKEEL